jgi:hypothetical protein
VTVRFEIVGNSHLQNGAVVYRDHEFSFDVEPEPIRGFTSILVNDLSLEIDEEVNLLSVWGLCPHPAWPRGAVLPSMAIRGAVKIRAGSPFSRGISVSLNQGDRWPIVYDKESGWVAVGALKNGEILVEFVSGAILGINGSGELRSLWLKAGMGL